MKKRLLMMIGLGILILILLLLYFKPPQDHKTTVLYDAYSAIAPSPAFAPSPISMKENGSDIEKLLHSTVAGLKPEVINKVLTTLQCAESFHVQFNQALTIIDYSLPSNQKRLWVFDLTHQKLLYHTYVSHGLRSGELSSQYFSNRNNSKASSIGIFKTDKPYYGRHGLSLKLDGLDQCFNDNASNRAVVMHGGWYVEESFIKKYGRAGRSWGCPAVPDSLYADIIDTIKDNGLLVVYYPSDDWFLNSKFLSCAHLPSSRNCALVEARIRPPLHQDERYEPVLFADLHHKNAKLEETSPILAMPVTNYAQIFQMKPPLARMLRRQVNATEYIALSVTELNKIRDNPSALPHLYFMLPVLKMVHGYYATEMQVMHYGTVKTISPAYTVTFYEKGPLQLISTQRFIRWLGL